MGNLFINERVTIKDIVIPQYPHLKDVVGLVTAERKRPPFGKCLVVRFSMNGVSEWTYLKDDQLTSAEGQRNA